MSHFRRYISGNCWIVGDRQEDGTWDVRVVDGKSEPIIDGPQRTSAVLAALDDESKLRSALWAMLPDEVRASILEERRRA